MRRRRFAVLAAAGAAVLAGAALAATAPSSVKTASNGALNATVLVNTGGYTLYHLTAEKPGKIGCTGACATMWPPQLVPAGAKPIAGVGVNAHKLGTVKRPDGRLQLTYAGYPLYRYSLDRKAGQANGEGVENLWFAVAPSGKLVKTAPQSSSDPSTTGTTSTGTGGGYGGGYTP
jgi:predicted lipoprotein with Yx(FWY)xxD motif